MAHAWLEDMTKFRWNVGAGRMPDQVKMASSKGIVVTSNLKTGYVAAVTKIEKKKNSDYVQQQILAIPSTLPWLGREAYCL